MIFQIGKSRASGHAPDQPGLIRCPRLDLAFPCPVSALALGVIDIDVEATEIRFSDRPRPSRLEYLKTILGIRLGQQVAWSEHAVALQTHREALHDKREENTLRPVEGGAPARLNESPLSRRRLNQLDESKAILEAEFDELHAALNASQQRTANAFPTTGECRR